MEFYLVKNQKVEFEGPGTWIGEGARVRTPKELVILLEPISDDAIGAQKYCKYLKNMLVENSSVRKTDLVYQGGKISPNLSVSLAMAFPPSNSKGHLKIFQRDDDLANGCIIFERLSDVFENNPDKVLVSLTFKGCIRGVPNSDVYFEAKEMRINCAEGNHCNPSKYFCESIGVEIPRNLAASWANTEVVEGVLTISIMLNHEAVDFLQLDNYRKPALTYDNYLILEKGLFTDLVIVAANGAEIKCHKCFLAVSSERLKGILERRPSNANSIKMPDMTEQGVRAFLNFIYHKDIADASASCDVALELFRAADKYDIPDLKSKMTELIGAKPREWFGVDMAVGLLMFCKKMECQDEEFKSLMVRAAKVIKWYSETDKKKLFGSKEYQKWHGDLETSMEFSALLLKLT